MLHRGNFGTLISSHGNDFCLWTIFLPTLESTYIYCHHTFGSASSIPSFVWHALQNEILANPETTKLAGHTCTQLSDLLFLPIFYSFCLNGPLLSQLSLLSRPFFRGLFPPTQPAKSRWPRSLLHSRTVLPLLPTYSRRSEAGTWPYEATPSS